MKSSDLWKKLPTAAELLDNPRVRSVVDRLNPTVVTAQVRGFLDEIRTELASRADGAKLPTFAELAERVSRYLSGADSYRVGGAINATGVLRGAPWVSAPLAEAAVARMLLTAQDFNLSRGEGQLDEDARRLLCELTGAEAAAVFTSHAAALGHVLRTATTGDRVIIARGEVGTVDANCRLTDLAMAAGATLLEVGAADSVNTNDYDQALAGAPAVVLRLAVSSSGGAACRPSLADLARCVKHRGGTVFAELGAAALRTPDGFEADGPTAKQAIDCGADLVLLRGDGLVGGPPCGVALGSTQVVQQLIDSPLMAACRIDAFRAAALAATLRLQLDPQGASLSVPVLQLCSTPLENLRNRAERLAPQLAASPLLAAADAVEIQASATAGAPVRLASWGVRVRPRDASPVALAERLRAGSPPLEGKPDGETLLLDLRTVFARQDLDLVRAFEPDTPADSAEDRAADQAV